MTDCHTPELQDQLPDFLAGTLRDGDRARVMAHLAQCDVCASDLAVLQQVRAARPMGAAVDVAAIVASLPRPATHRAPALQLHTSETTVRPAAGAQPARSPSRSFLQGPALWRVAATIGVVLAGGMSLIVARQGQAGLSAAPDALQMTESTTLGGATPTTTATPPQSTTAATDVRTGVSVSATATTAHADVPVSYGGLDNPTEDELQRLLDRLEQWDGATSAEPASALPVVTARGGDTP